MPMILSSVVSEARSNELALLVCLLRSKLCIFPLYDNTP